MARCLAKNDLFFVSDATTLTSYPETNYNCYTHMKYFIFIAFALLIIVGLTQTACYYDNEKDLYGDGLCDTTAVRYSIDVKPIVDANCVSCHAPGGQQEGSPLLTYDDVVKYTGVMGSSALVDRTNGTSSLMPPSGKMSACNIAIIAAWVSQGSLNN